MKDLFKKKSINQATYWDWNYHTIVKRCKGDTQKLHRLSRRKLKQELKKEKEQCEK